MSIVEYMAIGLPVLGMVAAQVIIWRDRRAHHRREYRDREQTHG